MRGDINKPRTPPKKGKRRGGTGFPFSRFPEIDKDKKEAEFGQPSKRSLSTRAYLQEIKVPSRKKEIRKRITDMGKYAGGNESLLREKCM